MPLFLLFRLRWLWPFLGAVVLHAQDAADRAVAMPGGWTWHSPPEFRIQHGDDERWSAKAFDDSSWPTLLPSQLPARTGVYWLRFKVSLPEPAKSGAIADGISLTLLAAYDLYWDGRQLHRNGVPGASRETEIPGNIDALIQIPAELATPGEHQVALRISTFHNRFPGPHSGINLRLGNFADNLVQRTRHSLQSLIALGGLAVFAVAFLIAWLLLDRKPAVLLFAGVAAVGASIQGLQGWRGISDYAYSWHYPRVVLLTLLVMVLGSLLVAAILSRFDLNRKGWTLGVLAGLFVFAWMASPLFSTKGYLLFVVVLVVSAGLVGRALMLQRPHAAVLGGGLLISLISLVGSPGDFAERTFLPSFGATLAGAFASLGLGWRDERRAARQAQLTAARLEIELLKKNIQPHFLMNTLTTLMEVVESDPKQAVRLINALAAEFHILTRVSGEKLIPLSEEIALCEAHLQIMSIRYEQPCELTTEGVEPDLPVPPALFHTLVENSFKHQHPPEGPRRFHLRGGQREGKQHLEFLAPGATSSTPPDAELRDGTGLRYIRARLEESFPGRWTLQASTTASGWLTTVEISPTP